MLRIAFLGCGFITRLHSRHLRSLRPDVACAYASRDLRRAEEFRVRYGGFASYPDYRSALADARVDAVVIAVPPRFHLELTEQALAAGKHVLVEKPAYPRLEDYHTAIAARDASGRVVIVGENDHYKPLAVRLRGLIAAGVIGEMVFAHFTSIAKRLKTADDWRNDESMAGGDAFFEEGIHWLHVAGSLGPRIVDIRGYRPSSGRASAAGAGDTRDKSDAGDSRDKSGAGDTRDKSDAGDSRDESDAGDSRDKSMMVAFRYDNGAVGSLYYSREIPSLLRGLRLSKLYGRDGIISFESNGIVLVARGRGLPRVIFPGFVDIRGYKAMYRDFRRAIETGSAPEMSLERAMDDHRLMDQVYATL